MENVLTYSDMEGPYCPGATGKMTQENPCQGKYREFMRFCQNTGSSICSNCQFSDVKDTEYVDIYL